ncbi:hypothetical protein [Polaribacter sp. WD7]|uniref:hypothetical protein n=1 Tax=Polaribacter sp. WD7 TaxID=2269061 RepID=UPI0011BF7997|nr:hypothetical protein [Polaribacter sp. WD7]
MKNFLQISLVLILNFSINAQDLAMSNMNNISNYEKVNEEIIPLIDETHYTYKYNGNDVLVSFKDGEHTEYFENKKYFIKSKVRWISNEECIMTIQFSNLPNFPFRKGTELKMKILKIRRGKVFYQSTLGGRTWTGKMSILQ